MRVEALRAVLLRDLDGVAREVGAYPSDELLWREVPGIRNSSGTLALHLAGNLRHFVGAVLGGSGYVRDREAEFSRRGVPRSEVRAAVEAAAAEVASTLDGLAEGRLDELYPLRLQGRSLRTGDFLLHLAVHLGYHLGQMDYHRRFLVAGAEPLGIVSTGAIPEVQDPGDSR